MVGWIAIASEDQMPVTRRRTNRELQVENDRLGAENSALRQFVFDLDLGRENANLEAQRATLERFLQEHPAPEPFLPLKQIDAGTHGRVTLWRWASGGQIGAELRNGQWFAKQTAVNAHIQRLQGG